MFFTKKYNSWLFSFYNISLTLLFSILAYLIVEENIELNHLNVKIQNLKNDLISENNKINELFLKYEKLHIILDTEKQNYNDLLDQLNKKKFLLLTGSFLSIGLIMFVTFVYLTSDIYLFEPEEPVIDNGPDYYYLKWLDHKPYDGKPTNVEKWRKEIVTPQVDHFQNVTENEILPTLPIEAQIGYKILKNNTIYYDQPEEYFNVNNNLLIESKNIIQNENTFNILEKMSKETDLYSAALLFKEIYPQATFRVGIDPRSTDPFKNLLPEFDIERKLRVKELRSERPMYYHQPEHYYGIGFLPTGYFIINDDICMRLENGEFILV